MNWKRLSLYLIVAIVIGVFGLPMAQAGGGGNTTPLNTGQWFATYYPNEDLSGNPVAIRSEATIGGNWGFGTPVPSLPNDHWSARWVQTFDLTPGQYRVTLTADDGVRVYINGNIILDEWHGHFPQTYTADFTATSQAQTINVEFFDGIQQAYLTFELAVIEGSLEIPVGTTATILSNNTNGYFEPNANATVRYILPRGAAFEVISTTPNRQWVQVQVNGIGIWVQSQYVSLSETIGVQQPTPIPPTPIPPAIIPPITTSDMPQATVTANVLNVREAPDVGSQVITQIRQNETYTVRRGSVNGWLQLIINGELGWVSDDFVALNNRQNLVNLAGNSTATVRAARLNVRERPWIPSSIVTKANRLETHPIVGRDDSGEWLMLDVNGVFGWVNADYVDVDLQFALPVVGDVPPVIPPAQEYILATATPYNVNMRQGPGTNFADLGNFDRGDDAKIIGRTADNNWWQIEYNGITAWVAAEFAHIQENADLSAIPVTG